MEGQLLLRGGRWQTGKRGADDNATDGTWRGVICRCVVVIVHTANCVEGTLYLCVCAARRVVRCLFWCRRRGQRAPGIRGMGPCPSFSFRQVCVFGL